MAKKKVIKKKKLLKPAKPSELDLARKAKPTGYRYKTTDVKGLHKKDGDLSKKGKELFFKKPTKSDIEKFKKNPDGSFPSQTTQIYHETRQDRTHSDDSPKKKFEEGGTTSAAAPAVLVSWEEMKTQLGREPKYPFDYIDGKRYEKCFMKPFFRCVE